MPTPQRLDALEAGVNFKSWIFSDHSLSARKPELFFASLGMSWGEIAKRCKHSDTAISAFLESFENQLPPEKAYVFAWFELGRRTTFLADLAGSGAPAELHQQAMAGYHSLLAKTAIAADEKERLEALVRDVADGLREDEEVKLQRILQRLRQQALALTPSRVEPVLWKDPWARGGLYVFAAVVIGSLLLASLRLLPALGLLAVIAGSVLGTGVLGAIQLRDYEDLREESFLKLMASSFTHLPLIRRRREPNAGE